MVTVSHLVKKLVNESPLLIEALSRGIVSYAGLAEELHDKIEKELEKEVKISAIVMALRRHSRELEKKYKKTEPFQYQAEIIMKTNLVDISIVKSPSLFDELEKILSLVDYEKGDTLNVIHGNYEVSIVTNEKYKDKVIKILKEEEIINTEENLVSLALNLNPKFFETPGIISNLSRHLAWNNINITEIVSTYTELNFIIHKKDATKAYEILNEIVEG